MVFHIGKRCLLDMRNCGLIPMLLLILQVALEQELHLSVLQKGHFMVASITKSDMISEGSSARLSMCFHLMMATLLAEAAS